VDERIAGVVQLPRSGDEGADVQAVAGGATLIRGRHTQAAVVRTEDDGLRWRGCSVHGCWSETVSRVAHTVEIFGEPVSGKLSEASVKVLGSFLSFVQQA
jgi:hypothetical protein